MSNQYSPHQQRVIDEHAELDNKIYRLGSFLQSERVLGVEHDEVLRLKRQHEVMCEYSSILTERIKHFAQ